MTPDEVVKKLDEMQSSDPEIAHGDADALLLAFITEHHGTAIEAALGRLIDRCSWWACA